MNKVYSFSNKQMITIDLSHNRGFLYGDGFFETMISINKKLIDFDLHYQRLNKALKAYHFKKLNLTKNELLELIKHLSFNKTDRNQRIKLIFFRDYGGYFSPKSDAPLLWVDSTQYQKIVPEEKRAFISKDNFTNYTNYSFCKSISAIQYILAGCELKNSEFLEIILTDKDGYISETISSNIFWIENNLIYTPDIQTGCVAGIKRQKIINEFEVEEGFFTHERLKTAEIIFTTNVAGSHILKYNLSIKKNIIHPLYNLIIEKVYPKFTN